MVNKISINRATNANIYVDGQSFIGRAEEVTLPNINFKMADHSSLGMVGELEYFAGIDKMEAKIKWNSYYPEVLKKFSNPFNSVKLQVRSSVDTYEDNSRVKQMPLVVYLTVRPKSNPLGTFKSQENVDLENTLSVSYVKIELNGEVLTEVDVEANIFFSNGVDLLKEYRQNLGI